MRRRSVSIVAVVVLTAPAIAGSRSVWDGIYTVAQSERGRAVYDRGCARCHGATLLGGDDARPLVGAEFLEKWHGKTVGNLFDIIRRTMPSDGPGTVTRAEASDVVAYLLSANAFPAGQAELETEEGRLNEIQIEPRKVTR